MSVLDMVQQNLGQSEISQISQHLGVDPSVAQTAISAALPMIVGGMARHTSQPEGADAVKQAIGAHEDVVDDVPGILQAGPPADAGGAGGLLSRIFGSHQTTVQQGVQQASGLDSDKAKKLLLMLSPLVLGVLAKQKFGGQQAQQANSQQVAGALQQEAQAAQRQAPHVGGLLGKLLGAAESATA